MQKGKIPSEADNHTDHGNASRSKRLRRRYADFFEFAPVGYFTLDRSGYIRKSNSAGAVLLGTTPKKMLNQQFTRYLSPDSHEAFELHCRRLFDTRTKQICDLRLLNPKQKTTWIQLESVALRNGGGVSELFRTVMYQISDRKQAEERLRKTCDQLEQELNQRAAALKKMNDKLHRQIMACEHAQAALKEAEQKYSTLVEDALIGVYIIKDGKIEFANQKFAAIYGYAKSELIGMDSLELVHPEDRTMIREMRTKRLRGETVPSEYEIRGRKKNGDIIWVMRSLSLIHYQDGPAIAGMVSDMTKRIKAEEALRRSGKELRILSNQLLSAEEKERKRIARELHDGIGQALSAIKFSVENSLRELRNQAAQSELKSLQAIIPLTQKTIEEVRRIVKDLRPSILDDLGILATITWFCREFQNVYANIRINSEVDIREEVIPSPLKTIIYRILQEALNNIAKHSHADTIQLMLKEDNQTIKLKIQDNGDGFDLNQAMSLKPSRRGFGLASMRERAQLSGASFDIKSVLDEGTTIWVTWEM
jgi:PAS domain S-box-containing protein